MAKDRLRDRRIIIGLLKGALDAEDFLKRHSGGNLLEHEFLGEIIICPAQVAKDAKELQKTLNQELSWVVVHGALHLLGYDHEHGGKDALTMRKKEEFYLGSKI